MANGIDELADRLASQEVTSDGADDPTLEQVKAELETLSACIRSKPVPDAFVEESALRRGLELVRAIGRELSEGRDRLPEHESLEGESLRDYQLLAKLGQGGMGTVYKALHTKLDKVVALKVVGPRHSQSDAAIGRFEREMKAIGRLEHPNIVRATDAGEADGRHFLVMELVDGVDLSRLVKRLGPLSIADACELIRQAATGLQEAHDHGLIHRDIKPSNLMLASRGRAGEAPVVKILDLGLALLAEVHHDGSLDELTTTGQLMGTLDYMSPEQAENSHVVDARSDIYSLGATFYKLLCGTAPFSGPRYDSLSKMIVALTTTSASALERPGAPAALVQLLEQMLDRDPQRRPATASAVAEALAPLAEGADLAALLRRAQSAGDTETASDRVPQPNDEGLSSADAEADPGIERPVLPAAPSRRRWLAAAPLALVICAATIVIVIRSDGNRAKVTIDSDRKGVRVTVEGDGVASETLPEGGENGESTRTPAGAVPPADDRRRAQQLLSLGAELGITADNRYLLVRPGDPLPTRPFRLVTLNVGGQADFNSDSLLNVSRSPWLVSIVAGDTSVDDAGLRGLVLPQLQTLHLHNTRVSDKGLEGLSRFNDLRSLHLAGTDLTDAGMRHLAEVEGLVELGVGSSALTDQGLVPLDGHDRLRMLHLKGTKVTAAGIARLQAVLPLCRIESDVPQAALAAATAELHDRSRKAARMCSELGVEVGLISPGQGFITIKRVDQLPKGDFHVLAVGVGDGDIPFGDDELARLNALPRLSVLGVSSTRVGDEGLRQLDDLPMLELLYLSDTRVTDAGLTDLKRFSRLSILHLNDTQVGDRGLEQIGACAGLQELELVRCQVTDAGLRHLHPLTNLKTVLLNETQVSESGVQALQRALPNCSVEWKEE